MLFNCCVLMLFLCAPGHANLGEHNYKIEPVEEER